MCWSGTERRFRKNLPILARSNPGPNGGGSAMASGPTHEVFNQPPVLEDYNLYAANLALQEAVEREGAGWAQAELDTRGTELGSAEWQQRGDLANRYPPT